MKIGIVGHEAAKFTPDSEARARAVIRALLSLPATTVVSGHCHLGGVDIYAEEEADKLGIPKLIFPPRTKRWHDGYKPRNLQIATASDVVHVIVVKEYPATYRGMHFDYCYHCDKTDHIKSGGCWTAMQARRKGKSAVWHIV